MRMLKGATTTMLTVGALVLTGCGTMKVWQDASPDFHFRAGQTYAWDTNQSTIAPERGENPRDLDHRVRGAVDAALADRGMKKALLEQADLTVRYLVVNEEITEDRDGAMTAMSDRAERTGDFGSMLGGTADRNDVTYDQGTLILQFLDRKSGKQVWRGGVTAEVHKGQWKSRRDARFNTAVRKLLAPPSQP